MEEVRRRVREYLGRHEGEGYGTRDKWIRGIGWDQKYFGGVMPTAVSRVVLVYFALRYYYITNSNEADII